MKVGIFIGSFNPVHLIHKKIVLSLIEEKIIDKVIVVPTGDDYALKDNLIDFNDRYNMLKLCMDDKNIIISDLEKEKYHYTWENIKVLKEKYFEDVLYLIIGADNLLEFTEWKNYEYVLENCNLIVFGRNNINLHECINNCFTNYKNKIIIKEEIGDLSSTLIRNLIKNNEDVHNYLDIKVMEYISKNHLYRR